MHGGDIYRNSIKYDFSVNINPLGLQKDIKWVLTEAALHADKYPDILNTDLTDSISEIFDAPGNNIIFGNGVSEILMAVCHAIMPKKVLLPAPCFLGYKYCITGANKDCGIAYHRLDEKNDFKLDDGIIKRIEEKNPEILFLTNPNNPNGLLIEKNLLKEIVQTCDRANTILVLDECFIALTGHERERSLAYYTREYKNLIVLRAFTKTFALPGVRLGYAICSDKKLADEIKRHIPEWNISIFAQTVGGEALKHPDYVKEAVELIKNERAFLAEALGEKDFKAYPSEANYILFKAGRTDLKEELAAQGILIRNCGDYEGLDGFFYRIAVRNHDDNVMLIRALSEGGTN